MLRNNLLKSRVTERLFMSYMLHVFKGAPLGSSTAINAERLAARVNTLHTLQKELKDYEFQIMAQILIEEAFTFEFAEDLKRARAGGELSPQSLFSDVALQFILRGSMPLKTMTTDPEKQQRELKRSVARSWKGERCKKKYITGASILKNTYLPDIESGRHSFSVPAKARNAGWSLDNPYLGVLLPHLRTKANTSPRVRPATNRAKQ